MHTGMQTAAVKYERITITLPKNLIEQLDRTRGDVARSTYVKRMLERYTSPLESTKITLPDRWLEQYLNDIIEDVEEPIMEGGQNGQLIQDDLLNDHDFDMAERLLNIVENRRVVILSDEELRWLEYIMLYWLTSILYDFELLRDKKKRTNKQEEKYLRDKYTLEEMAKYLELIGTSNPEALKQIKEALQK